jgi:GTPase
MGQALHADVSILRKIIIQQDRVVAEVLVRKYIDEEQFMELKVAVIGSSDSGKSTLLGLLSYEELDNGRGKARLNLLRHRHEIASGRTSSITRQMIGFDTTGDIVNFSKHNIQTIEHICEASPKVITFLDTCGFPKYQKTTISGLTGHNPDYACLIVACNSGSLHETAREHLGIAVALNVSVFICMTKTDISTPEQLTRTVSELLVLLKSPGLKRVPMVIQNEDDVVASIHSFTASK